MKRGIANCLDTPLYCKVHQKRYKTALQAAKNMDHGQDYRKQTKLE